MNKGILLVLSGFSGSGKGTVVKELLHGKLKRDDCWLSVSATSRNPRPGEEDGREYFFKTREEFEMMIKDDEFFEYAEYVGNYYGTPKKAVFEKLESGINVILEIEVKGAMQIKEKYPDAVTVFLTPPNAKELEARLRGRNTESEDVIQGRLERAKEECKEMFHYDYLIINDEVDLCTKRLSQLIDSQKRRMSYQMDIVLQMEEDLKQLNTP